MADAVFDAEPPVQFQYKAPPAKKRRFIRQRGYDDDEPATTSAAVGTDSVATTTDGTAKSEQKDDLAGQSKGEEQSSLVDLAKLRKKTRARQGLQLTVDTPHSNDHGGPERQSKEDAKKAEFEAITNRFTHQTGQVLDVDKHMMEYIEKKMSSKHMVEHEKSRQSQSEADALSKNDSRFNSHMQIRGATLGKLHEVDLGEEIKLKNSMRTEEAIRRLEGGEPMPEEDTGGKKRRGKRRRRNSQDIQRDKLVEEVLKETRLEIYDEPEQDEYEDDGEGATDDKIVERFRKEFLDALNLRKGRRKATAPAKKKDDKTRPKGPKLGGSRMARAAMREQQTGTKK